MQWCGQRPVQPLSLSTGEGRVRVRSGRVRPYAAPGLSPLGRGQEHARCGDERNGHVSGPVLPIKGNPGLAVQFAEQLGRLRRILPGGGIQGGHALGNG